VKSRSLDFSEIAAASVDSDKDDDSVAIFKDDEGMAKLRAIKTWSRESSSFVEVFRDTKQSWRSIVLPELPKTTSTAAAAAVVSPAAAVTPCKKSTDLSDMEEDDVAIWATQAPPDGKPPLISLADDADHPGRAAVSDLIQAEEVSNTVVVLLLPIYILYCANCIIAGGFDPINQQGRVTLRTEYGEVNKLRVY